MDSRESNNTYRAILKTICYADIFDYPLKEEEVSHFLCHPEPFDSAQGKLREGSLTNDIRGDIKKANGVIHRRHNFMFLKDRDALIPRRLEREAMSKRKLLIAKGISRILKYIPTVKLIGVSGSVAAYNADKKDDIDMFIITQTKTVWLTRLLTTILVELFGRRRRPGDTNVIDKICLNMFVDEDYVAIPKERRNLYTAHEVCQLKVLYDRDGTYQKFLTANSWVKKFLPNALARIKDEGLRIKKNNIISFIIHHSSFIIEPIAKHLQLFYMRKRRTTEAISDYVLAFHPKDYTADVLTALEERLKLYGSQV